MGWLSSQQPFVALSTAEAEIMPCTEGIALSQALLPLIEELAAQPTRWCLYNDSIACSSILSYPAGSWRTRHLRLRSKAIQEMISEDMLTVHHIAGKYMIADLLTKPLAPAKVWELLEYTGFDLSQVDKGAKSRRETAAMLNPSVRILMVSLLVVPADAQGPEVYWGISEWTCRIVLGLGIGGIVLGIVVWCLTRRQRRLRVIVAGRESDDSIPVTTQRPPGVVSITSELPSAVAPHPGTASSAILLSVESPKDTIPERWS